MIACSLHGILVYTQIFFRLLTRYHDKHQIRYKFKKKPYEENIAINDVRTHR